METVNDLIRQQKKIDAFIIEYNLTIAYCTLYELEKAICKFLGIDNYDKLYVGPLHDNNLVRELFQMAGQKISNDDLNLNKITYLDLFRYLRTYLDDQKLWSYNKLDLNEFNAYLKDKLQLAYLPVRINNISLMVASMKKVKWTYYASLNKCFADFETEIKAFYMDKYSTIRTNLEAKFAKLDNMVNIGDVNTIDLIKEFFYIFQLFYSKDYTSSSTNRNQANETEFYCISEFFNLLKQNAYLSELFHLVLCFVESKDVQTNLAKTISLTTKNKNRKKKFFKCLLKSLMRMLVDILNKGELKAFLKEFLFEYTENEFFHIIFDKDISRKHVKFNDQPEAIGTADDPVDYLNDFNKMIDNVSPSKQQSANSIIKPSKPELIAKIRGVLADFKHRPTVQSLHASEMKLCTIYNVNNFDVITQDQSYLKFIVDNQYELDLDLADEQKVGKIDGNHLDAFLGRFLANCSTSAVNMASDEKCLLEKLLCNQFCLENVRALNYKSIDALVDDYQHAKINAGTGNESNQDDDYYYENCILSEYNFLEIDTDYECLLGSIEKCPLLANLTDYLQWNVIYAGKYGDLKEFLSKKTSFKCIEIEPYKVLKLASQTGLNQLKDSILSLNAHLSAAHLLSLVTLVYRSLKQAPLALLSNEFEYLFKVLIGIDVDTGNDRHMRQQFYLFLVKFICHMPLKFVSNCLSVLFVDPLVKIEGSLAYVKEIILDMLKSSGSNDECRYFYYLSVLCSIPEWSGLWTVSQATSIAVQAYVPDLLMPSSTRNTNEACESPILMENQECARTYEIETVNCNYVTIEASMHDIEAKQEFIENIRKNKYGIGLESTTMENELVMRSLKNEISSCLRTLSNELYNKDMHFVLELIQNADDNQYSNANSPTLVFLIESNSITLFNNELGFEEKNIQAICAVGASTKGKHKQGYIGRKGLFL